ncbi:MAG: T9SS type A sorting domain-containing protein [Bacteroidetes bacterium]|nr:T9SS type A sorting domain-containing protein [Bacteroidota bacterium]
MKRFSILTTFLVLRIVLTAQTGPAGIGTSSTNVLWLKADAGTSSTTNGTAISAWNDQSGNSINVTQTVSVKQPSFATNVFNGFPAINFDNIKTNNDKLTAADSPLLDNTSGYTFFTVTRPVSYEAGGNDARVVLSKRNNVDTEESFMLFHYTSNNFYVDLQTTDNRFNSSPTAYALGTNCLIDVVYDGSLSSGSRSKIYSTGALIKTATETNTLIPDNNSPLIIGSTDIGDPRPFGGYIGEIIVYRVALNKASRIIIDNYLSAKYNIALSSNDKYAGDNSGNGDYDRDIAGIGQDTTMPGPVVGSNTTFSASATSGLGISVLSGMGTGDYILAGHATAVNSVNITDVSGISGTNPARWQRVWYIDVTNAGAVMQADIEFDMAAGGMSGTTPTTASNYKLLYRSGTSGTWSEVATASSISGSKIIFASYNFNNNGDDGYYTIGTKNYTTSPLPIELISFDAIMNGNNVDITWATATESNNDYYTIEKSKNGIDFEALSKVDAAGNSLSIINYKDIDVAPYEGISYYRLKQTDFDGSFSYSKIVAVNYRIGNDGVSIFPNPTDGNFTISLKGLENEEILVVIRDISGKEWFSKVILTKEDNALVAIDTEGKLAKGTYLVMASSNNQLYSQKIIVK